MATTVTVRPLVAPRSWRSRRIRHMRGLFPDSPAASPAPASRMLLVAF
jgi:hypothetical protein